MSLDEDDNILCFPAGTLPCTWVSGQKLSLTRTLLSSWIFFSLVILFLSFICVSRPNPIWFTTVFLIKCIFFFPIPLCFFPFALFTLRGSLPPSLMGKTSIRFSGRNRGKQLVDRNIPPSALPPSPPPSFHRLFTGICAVWMWVNEGHLVADWEPNTLLLLLLLFLSSSNSDALLCFRPLQPCVQLCGPTVSTVTCSKLILRLPRVHASAWNAYPIVAFGCNLRASGCSL